MTEVAQVRRGTASPASPETSAASASVVSTEAPFQRDAVVRAPLTMPSARRALLDRALGLQPPSGLDAPQLDPRYFDVTRAVQHIDQLVARYSSLAMKVDLSALPGAAKTHDGESIMALKLAGSSAPGVTRPAVVIAAQHHAREINSGYVAISAMDRLTSGYGTDPAITKLLDERDVYVVPVVNPDGVRAVWTEQRMWRKNRTPNADGTTGVDVNRNYPFLFGACGSSASGASDVFRGPAPASEPEVRTMMALQRAVRPELYIDFHSYGNEVLGLYAPCATVTPEMQTLSKHYNERLRTPMGFGNRPPSGSGEGPQWYWSQGSLAYLVEVGNAFQPRFEDTVRDEAKVWSGLKDALTTWAPAARGHVTDAQGAPVEATFTVQQPIFKHGETLSSRASDGAFSLWLPVGTWDLVVSAPGYAPKTERVTVDAYDRPQALEVRLDRAQR